MTEFLTLQDIADRMHVSVRTIRRLVSAGRIRVIHVGRKPLVTVREYEAFIAALRKAA